MSLTKALSIVVPVHNEALNLKPLLDEIVSTLEDLCDYEIIYVEDGSSDDTFQRLLDLKPDYPRLRILQHAKSYGQSTALASGVRASYATHIATLDGDGQNDPADIPRLWQALQSMPEKSMVAGFRKNRKDTSWRRFSSRLANAVRGRLLKDQTPDTGCGLKIFSRALFLELPYFDHMHRFLPALARRAGAEVISIEVNHRQRLMGISNYGTWHRLWVGIIDLFGVIWLQNRAHIAELKEIKTP